MSWRRRRWCRRAPGSYRCCARIRRRTGARHRRNAAARHRSAASSRCRSRVVVVDAVDRWNRCARPRGPADDVEPLQQRTVVRLGGIEHEVGPAVSGTTRVDDQCADLVVGVERVVAGDGELELGTVGVGVVDGDGERADVDGVAVRLPLDRGRFVHRRLGGGDRRTVGCIGDGSRVTTRRLDRGGRHRRRGRGRARRRRIVVRRTGGGDDSQRDDDDPPQHPPEATGQTTRDTAARAARLAAESSAGPDVACDHADGSTHDDASGLRGRERWPRRPRDGPPGVGLRPPYRARSDCSWASS